ILYDASYVLHMGFQFSFAITAAILLFSGPLSKVMSYFLPTRRLSEAIQWDCQTQAAYIVSVGLREAVALSAAVNIAAIP
ncbi:ComEC/Rec2 family competence protein, partial [Pseudomonas aeruginosa]